MKEEIIIRVLDRAMSIIDIDQARQLRGILEEELYNYELHPIIRALVPANNIRDRIILYLAAKRLDGLALNSLKSYKRHLAMFCQYMQKDIETITSMDIRMYMAARAKTGIKNSTMATIISSLKSFFSWLEDEEYIQRSPMRKIKTVKTDKYVRKSLTAEELELIRDACHTERERALVEVFYSTGSRLDEIQKLNKDDIDWSTGKVLVFGKGRKERHVYLNAKAKVFLWKYLNIRTDTNEALFVGERKPYGRLGRRSIENTFSDLGIRAGITKAVYPHLVRHTTATNMLNNGGNLAEVQRYLGHNSPATTQIYAQLDTDAIQQSHKKHVV